MSVAGNGDVRVMVVEKEPSLEELLTADDTLDVVAAVVELVPPPVTPEGPLLLPLYDARPASGVAEPSDGPMPSPLAPWRTTWGISGA